jgi:hypothetical protein
MLTGAGPDPILGDAKLSHPLLDVELGDVLPFPGRPKGVLCGVGRNGRVAR